MLGIIFTESNPAFISTFSLQPKHNSGARHLDHDRRPRHRWQGSPPLLHRVLGRPHCLVPLRALLVHLNLGTGSLRHLYHTYNMLGSSTKSYNLKYPEHVLSAGKHLSVSGSFFLPADWFPFDRHTSYSAVCYLTSWGNQVLAESESPLIFPISVNPLSFREPS